tara:strand:+ start:519 stop:698 length:180 start_codon:yes stop_codon:yes gene_type:complete
MSQLKLVQRAIGRKQQLNEAQMAHLRHTAYRGVDTSAHQPPHKAYKSAKLSYRGVSYSK